MGEGVIPALQKAQQAGVKIVFVDNTLPGFTPDAVSATDNVKGGQAAGAYIKTQLKSGDTIGLMEAVKGVPALDARIDGVKKALEGTGVKVVIGGQQTTCDPKIGATVTQDLLTKYPNLTAIYSACDSPAMGASTVAKQKNHPLKIYGYDGDPEMSKLILSGDTTATMAQSPFKMTNLGIAAAVNALAGQAVREVHRHRRHAGDQGQRRPVQGRLAVAPDATEYPSSRAGRCPPDVPIRVTGDQGHPVPDLAQPGRLGRHEPATGLLRRLPRRGHRRGRAGRARVHVHHRTRQRRPGRGHPSARPVDRRTGRRRRPGAPR